jgi:hypothetical protein
VAAAEGLAAIVFTTIHVVIFLAFGWGRVKLPLLCALLGSGISWAAWFAFGKQNWIVMVGFFVSFAVLWFLELRRHRKTMRNFDGDWRK